MITLILTGLFFPLSLWARILTGVRGFNETLGTLTPTLSRKGEGVKTVQGNDASLTGQGCVNRLRVESTEALVTNDNHRQ